MKAERGNANRKKVSKGRGLSSYSSEAFEFTDNFIRATFKYNDQSSVKTSVKTDDMLLSFIVENAMITIPELAEKIGVTSRSIERRINRLKGEGRLDRIGSAKGGKWKVL